ncbi:hypothetical protein EB796_011145 [Bugula neritina]|uniref:Uncharacterized protein n=1 Tax=Bugula neritina TaxID=10212 RepID=A0A7J7JX57_BUGNE|nr:hypothetical protein EB796_011145 [Bugula neritina]
MNRYLISFLSLVYETPHGSTSQQKDERFTASGSSLPENEPEYDDQLMDSNSLDGGPSSLPAEYMGPDLVDLLAEYEQPFRADPPLDLKQSLPVDKQLQLVSSTCGPSLSL